MDKTRDFLTGLSTGVKLFMTQTYFKSTFKALLVSGTALTALNTTSAVAQEQIEDMAIEELIVTATRRSASVQDIPINITAISGNDLQDLNILDIQNLGAYTPGLTTLQTGPRSSGQVVLRGLSADDTSTFGENRNTSLATYLGEIPLFVDFRLVDMERVEVLLGPQGTLYGQGTLAGAIRYIPVRPNAQEVEGYGHGRLYDVAHGGSVGFNVDGAVNIPIIEDKLALRSTIAYYNDPGFVDYPFALQEVGVSLPQPGTLENPLGTPEQRAANFAPLEDVNDDETIMLRNSLGFFPTEWATFYFTHVYQKTETNGRQATSPDPLGAAGPYEGPWRLAEPASRKTNLFALEAEIDIGDFAQLVTATAITRQTIRTTSDITDLLLDLDYDYEAFPAFAGPTNGFREYKQFNQEVRLVSQHDGPISWVIGGFYNKFEEDFQGLETLPGFPEFAGIDRSDNAEFVQFIDSDTKELAFFGEVAYEVTDALTITGGVRYYDYEANSLGGQRLPLFQEFPIIESFPIVPPEGTELAALFGGGTPGSAEESGVVYKANISYKINSDILVYFTYSTGYRIGGANRVAPCPPNVQELVDQGLQQICALPDELSFGPDETKNKEIGIKGTFLDGRLTGSIAAYHIGWDGIQLAGATQNGIVGITENGGTAVSKGFEMQFNFRATDNWTINGNYAFTDAKLTQTVPNLLSIRLPGFPGGNNSADVDALDGARLPGSTKNSFLLGTTYEYPLSNDASIVANWTTTYTGNILTRPGALAGGEVLPSYMLHQASIAYQKENWDVRLYATNLFDKYAVNSVSNDLTRQGLINDGVYLRRYAQSIIRPRNIGVEASFRF